MAQTYPLDPIIKKIDSSRVNSESNEKIVIVDINSRTVVSREKWLGSYKFYLVSNNEDPQSSVLFNAPPIYITDEINRTIICNVVCRLECEPGNEEIAVQNLWNEAHPGIALGKKNHNWLLQFAGRSKSQFIDNYYDKKTELITFLTENIAKTGLTATNLNISLKNESDALKPIHMNERQIQVRLKEAPEESELKFSGNLFVNDKKINAVAYHDKREQLFDSVENIIKTILLTDVSMDDIDLKSDEVKEWLRVEINRRIPNWGRQFNSIFLNIDIGGGEREHTTEKDIDVKILGYQTPIIIKSKVQLLRQDTARYKAKGSPNLDDWLVKALRRAANLELAEIQYIDLLLKMPEIEERLRNNLIIQAKDIGYFIKTLFAKPKLEQIDWLEPFDIPEITNQSFETQVAEFRVKLTIPIKAKLRNLKDVSEKLNQNIPALMREEIMESIQEFMHKIHPERFYMRFEFTTIEEEISISKEIYNIISKVLKEKFNALLISAVPKMGETEVTIKLRQLLEKTGTFKADIKSFKDRKNVFYEGSFRVVGVDADGWNNFEQQKIELSMIEQDIGKALETELSTDSSTELAFIDEEARKKLERRIRELSQNAIRTKYGLQIVFYSLTRDFTGIENAAIEIDDTWLNARVDEIKNQITEYSATKKILQGKLLQAIRTDEDDDEILKIKNRISIIETMQKDLSEERKLLNSQAQESKALPKAEDVDAKN